MHVYSELACRYGNVNPFDREAVLKFFKTGLSSLSPLVRKQINAELILRDNEPSSCFDQAITSKPTVITPPVESSSCGVCVDSHNQIRVCGLEMEAEILIAPLPK